MNSICSCSICIHIYMNTDTITNTQLDKNTETNTDCVGYFMTLAQHGEEWHCLVSQKQQHQEEKLVTIKMHFLFSQQQHS